MALFDTRPFADAEEVLRLYLKSVLAPNVIVVSATGPTIVTPTVVARRIGGDNDYITDYAVMMVSCFGAARPESNTLAAQIQTFILNAVNVAVGPLLDGTTALIDNAVVMVADHPEQYENPDVRQVSATYELRMRRPRPAA